MRVLLVKPNNLSDHIQPSLGLASFAARIFEYKKSANLEDEKKVNFHVADKRILIFYDRLFYRVSRFFDFIGLRYIFGKNILAVAKVKKGI